MHSTRAGVIEAHRDMRVGCDIHPVSNVVQSIEVFGDRYLARVFTPAEREYCAGPSFVEKLAGRFAAKEAVLKALQVPGDIPIPWPNIEVLPDAVGAPIVRLAGNAAAFAAARGVSSIQLSISHDDGFAFAFAIAVHDRLEQAA
ncbi:MAG: acpS [Rhodoglobus sp.]|jgi:holo-[acyl-carrier protein] synthase|nr:acpS [Rhodoglobus sp.]